MPKPKPYNDTEAALQDVASAPDVSPGEDQAALQAPAPAPAKGKGKAVKAAPEPLDAEPDAIEQAAGAVVSEAVSGLVEHFGSELSNNVNLLLTETMTGLFGLARAITGAGWLRYAVAGGALALWVTPHVLRFRERQKQEPQPEPEKKS